MGCGDVKRSFSVIILRQMHIKMTPLNGVDGGIMVGSVDGYQWIPKRSGVLFCLQFGEEKKKREAYSLISCHCVSPVML